MHLQQLSWPLLVSCCLVLTSLGCSTVRETGRRQLMLVTSDQEQTLGAQAYQEVLSKAKRSTDARMTAVVERVGKRIAGAADRPDFRWEFALIESDQVNAFCLPGGKIAVYTGILPIMKNEAGMAVVVGHEVAHAVARHGGERISQQMSVEIIQELLAQGLAKASPTLRSGALQAFGVGAQVGALLPYSRAHESEADQIGLIYAARAGYDPREAIGLWRRMEASRKSRGLEFLSTHPREERRIGQFEKEMPAALEAYRAARQQYGVGEQW
ncbi:MAG TPA: M48 family metallopeptidase [Phycisphaerae bacterium]|nr:M48 family metallopeptidase [Phycisphaerae bacterium]HRY69666.1 M48 family metallopeptidase [Phycisphaerae bacterium]HSA25137.1 M48 family metallopeptidase [Phycisphaerae bacterium]